MKIELVDSIDQIAVISPKRETSTPATRETLMDSLPRLGPTSTVLLIHLSKVLPPENEAVTIDIDTLCTALGVSRTQLQRTLNRLERLGVMTLTTHTQGAIIHTTLR